MSLIVALTRKGHQLAQSLQKKIPSRILYRPKPFSEVVQQAFLQGNPLIMICATGIVIRTLAPVIKNKNIDPAVIVIDERGQFVIPLLSGHEGGANQLGAKVAKLIDAQLVVTTSKSYIKPIYTVGMGCVRNCPENELLNLLQDCLSKASLSLANIKSINSIVLKSDEIGLINLTQALKIPFYTWNKDQLSTVKSKLSDKSEYVFHQVGVYGVAESAALYAAQEYTGETADLILVKQKTVRATCAIARSYFTK